jgi:hypothetical protein
LQLLLTGGVESSGTATGGTSPGAISNTDESWRHVKTSVLNPGVEAPRPGEGLTLACAPADIVVLAQ